MNNENIDHSLAIADLIAAYLKGELSVEKQELLLEWRSKNENNEALFKNICNEDSLTNTRKSFKNYDTNTALSKIHTQLEFEEQASRFVPDKLFKFTAIAAAIAIVFGVYLFWSNGMNKPGQLVKVNSVTPGRNLATLTLGNGTMVALQEIANGKTLMQANLSIVKVKEGEIVYHQPTTSVAPDISSQLTNTISTPRGGHYRVVLTDGTRVWLNAASSLTYSTTLIQNGSRKVELSGEAYFEVARNERAPFEVYSSKIIAGQKVFQQVKVLGTHFNVNAYNDETEIKTTLIEGAVQVSAGAQQKNYKYSVLLKPGELATLKPNDHIVVSTVEASESIAWKNDLFVFNDESIASIMRKISRWYDVDVVFEGIDQTRVFGGTISRFDDVNEVLEMLSLTEVMKFELKDRKIIVKP